MKVKPGGIRSCVAKGDACRCFSSAADGINYTFCSFLGAKIHRWSTLFTCCPDVYMFLAQGLQSFLAFCTIHNALSVFGAHRAACWALIEPPVEM